MRTVLQACGEALAREEDEQSPVLTAAIRHYAMEGWLVAYRFGGRATLVRAESDRVLLLEINPDGTLSGHHRGGDTGKKGKFVRLQALWKR